jgi:hypothetical protein
MQSNNYSFVTYTILTVLQILLVGDIDFKDLPYKLFLIQVEAKHHQIYAPDYLNQPFAKH